MNFFNQRINRGNGASRGKWEPLFMTYINVTMSIWVKRILEAFGLGIAQRGETTHSGLNVKTHSFFVIYACDFADLNTWYWTVSLCQTGIIWLATTMPDHSVYLKVEFKLKISFQMNYGTSVIQQIDIFFNGLPISNVNSQVSRNRSQLISWVWNVFLSNMINHIDEKVLSYIQFDSFVQRL